MGDGQHRVLVRTGPPRALAAVEAQVVDPPGDERAVDLAAPVLPVGPMDVRAVVADRDRCQSDLLDDFCFAVVAAGRQGNRLRGRRPRQQHRQRTHARGHTSHGRLLGREGPAGAGCCTPCAFARPVAGGMNDRPARTNPRLADTSVWRGRGSAQWRHAGVRFRAVASACRPRRPSIRRTSICCAGAQSVRRETACGHAGRKIPPCPSSAIVRRTRRANGPPTSAPYWRSSAERDPFAVLRETPGRARRGHRRPVADAGEDARVSRQMVDRATAAAPR